MVAAWLPGAVRWQPYGRLRVRAVQIANLCWPSGFCVGVWTMHRPRENLLGLCYILTKVEAASLSPASSVV